MPRVTLDLLHTIALVGALQGVLLAAVLVTKQQNRTANRLLAALMVSFTIGLLTAVYHGAKLERVFPHFIGVGYPMPLLYGPLLYLYAVTASNRRRHLTWKDALHFAPLVITVILTLPIYLMSGPEKLVFFEGLQRGEAPRWTAIVDPLKFVSGITYTVLTLLFLRRHRQRVKQSYSFLEGVNLRWLQWLCGSAALIWLLAVVLNVMQFENVDDFIALAVAILVYGIGYLGLRQPEIFRFESSDVAVPISDAEPPRYERSGLTGEEASALKDRLLALMDEQRPWENSELTLADLAGLLGTTPHKVSEVLNGKLGQTFYDFVNGYRVREVQRRIARDRKAPTLLALAFDAGFASKSTFNEAFKKHTGKTPSQYRQTAIQ